MTDGTTDEQTARRGTMPGPRGPSRTDKRRNRRRKSKFSRPVFSVAHGLTLALLALAAGFAVAIAAELTGGDGAGAARRAAENDPLRNLTLPGDRPSRRVGPPGFTQLLLWFYLFGTPALFALQRLAFWKRVRTGMQLVSYTMVGLWFCVIVVFFVLAFQG